MKPWHAVFAILALTVPTAAIAQSQDRTTTTVAVDADQLSGQDGPQQAGWEPTEVRAPIVLARAVARGPRGRVVVGPRGRVRTFAYRGRDVTVIRRPRYVYPRGFAYRHWRAGNLLPAALIAAPFFFLEYGALGLQPPPPGYRWVRYGPDVVLVNVRTREVEDVAYGAIDDDDD